MCKRLRHLRLIWKRHDRLQLWDTGYGRRQIDKTGYNGERRLAITVESQIYVIAKRRMRCLENLGEVVGELATSSERPSLSSLYPTETLELSWRGFG